jgi:formimidoylglutamate deiminase
MATRLFTSATTAGARSLGFNGGRLVPGAPADFFTVDLGDPSIAGASINDLMPNIIFSANRAAIRDVFVGGSKIISQGNHARQSEIVERFVAMQHRLWS